MQWRIQDFSEEGALVPKGRARTYYFANFSRKLHENEEILGRGGREGRAPLRSATEMLNFRKKIYSNEAGYMVHLINIVVEYFKSKIIF